MVSHRLETPSLKDTGMNFVNKHITHLEKQNRLRSSSFFVVVDLATVNISNFSPAKYFCGLVQKTVKLPLEYIISEGIN